MITIQFTLAEALGYEPCGAKIGKNLGEYCRRRPVKGRARCELHGGLKKRKTLEDKLREARRKVGEPVAEIGKEFRHARFSKLPPRLADRLKQAEDDPQLLSYRRDIELLEARVVELVERLSTGESGVAWKKAAEAWVELSAEFSKLETALRAGDKDKAQEHLTSLAKLIIAPEAPLTKILIHGNQDEQTWLEVADAAEKKARMIERENRRLIDLQQIMTIDQAMVLMAGLLSAVHRHVDSPEIKRAIGMEFAVLSNFSKPRPPTVIEVASAKLDSVQAEQAEREEQERALEAQRLAEAIEREEKLAASRDYKGQRAARLLLQAEARAAARAKLDGGGSGPKKGGDGQQGGG
jgi:hypothetical protein